MWLLCAIALLALAITKAVHAAGHRQRLPPTPPTSFPLIGHLHLLLGRGLPHHALRALAARYGPLLHLRLGCCPTLVVSAADVAADVFRSQQDLAFASRPRSVVADAIAYGSRNISFAPYGDHFRGAKKLAVVHLLNSKRVASFRAVRADELAVMTSKIAANAGKAIVMRELLYEYTNAVVSRAVAGDRGNAAKFQAMDSSALLSGLQIAELLPPVLAKAARKLSGLETKLKVLEQKTDEFMKGILEEHVRRGRAEGEEEDLVDVLLRLRRDGTAGIELGDDEIKAITKDLIAAATDTTFVTMEWTMAELARHPSVMTKLQDEVRRVAGDKATVSEDDLPRMEYMKAVIKEALRLHAPAPLLVPHESTAPVALRGFTIPPKTRLIINAWAIQRDPTAWDSPEEFRPERFLLGVGGENDVRKNDDFRFIPFGVGRRMCPGVNFAMATVETALASLVHRFDWRLPDGVAPADVDLSEEAGLTVRLRTPLCLVPTLLQKLD